MAKEKKPKPRARYGDYSTVIDGKLYAVVNIPQGNGRYKKKRKLVESKSDARLWALNELAKAKGGEVSTKEKTFSFLVDWYKKEYLIPPVYQVGKKLLGVRTYKTQQNTAERLKKKFGAYKLDHITIDVLRGYKKEKLKTVSISSVNRDFALMRTMFKKAKARKWMKESPFDAGENLIEIALEDSRKSPLTERIAKRLLARSRKSEQPLLHYLVLVLKNTGARPSEIYPYQAGENDDVPREPLIWKHILEFEFQAVKLVSYKGKKRKERIVPTSLELENGLRKFYKESNPQPGDLLFPVKDFKRSWKTLCKSVKVSGIWIRDFRHYFNSRILIQEVFNDVERMLLMGQIQLSTNLRYSHLDKQFIDKFRKATNPIQESDTVQ